MKIKADIGNGNSTVQIVGCHLLLQVLALDKIHLSSRHITQNILPRVKAFDHDSVKKAIEAITKHYGPETVFAGPDCMLNNETNMVTSSNHVHNTSEPIGGSPNVQISSKLHSLAIPRSATKNRASQPIGPVDFANRMRRKYPSMASDLLGILLKEHNSRLIANINEIRHSTQLAMFTFVDELVQCLSKKCTCCQLSGRNTCFLRERVDLNGTYLGT